jgi:GTP-binding protein
MAKSSRALPQITIVGRPNVGKSSLFNRITRTRRAIVHMEMGTTRDRIGQEVDIAGRRFMLTDTGGFFSDEKTRIFRMVKEQIKKAVAQTDVLLFVCDGQEGLTPQDMELAALLRKANKRIFLVVNKLDNKRVEEEALMEYYRLGLDRPYPVSALHNIGVADLLEEVLRALPAAGPEEKTGERIKVAVVGRPNVGKSSFINRLLQEERVIVDEMPGTTRDTVDTCFSDHDTEFILIDTAGLRHKRKIKEAVDVYSIMRTKEAILRSDACLVLIDAFDGLVADDLRILDMVFTTGKCCGLCVNKWDLIRGISPSRYKEMIYERAPFLTKYPVMFTSTKTGYNVYNSINVIRELMRSWALKVPTRRLNRLLDSLKRRGATYITQTAVRPPAFLIFVNDSKPISEERRNFIENLLRKNFNFFGSPIRLEFRGQGQKNRR